MLVKASILATVVLAATVTATSVDFRDLYNEMYPVNGLKRDVLSLCRQAKSTFVRAIRTDRENCYDSMPDSVELAIGWVRTSSLLAEMNKPTAIEAAEKALKAAIKTGQFGVVPQFTGFVAPALPSRPCAETTTAMAVNDPKNVKAGTDVARRVAGNDETTLAALGLAPRGAKPATQPGTALRGQDLPVLSLNGAGPPTIRGGQTATDCKAAI